MGRGARAVDLALLLAFLVLAWWRFLVGGDLLYSGDTFYYFYPYRHTLFSALQGGYFPDWEAGALSGNPFCANPQANCYYPLSLWYLLPDFFTAYHLALVSHLFLAGAGLYLWLVARGHSRLAAGLAALCFLSGGATLSMVNRLDKLESLTWWPWAMLGLERLMRGRRGGFAMLSAALALGLLAGGLEVWAMVVGSLVVWGMLAPLTGGAGAAPGAGTDGGVNAMTAVRPGTDGAGERGIRRRARGLIGLAGALLVCLLLTAPQWVSLRELLAASTRSGGMAYQKAVEMSLRPADLWGLILPHLFYDPATEGFHPVPGAPPISRYFLGLYLGWIPALAALAAIPLVLRRGPAAATVRICAAFIAGGLFFALGDHNPLYRPLFELVGPLRAVRYPEKFLSLSSFFGLPLVAIGIDRWLERPGRLAFPAGVGVLVALLLALPGAVPGGGLLSVTAGGPAEAWADRLAWLEPELMTRAVLLASAAGMGLLAARGRLRPALAAVLAGALVGLDLWTGTWALNPPMSGTVLRETPSFAARLQAVLPDARVHVLPLYGPRGPDLPASRTPQEAYVALWQMLYPNTGQLSGIRYADGSRAIRVDALTRFFAAFKGLPAERQIELAAVAGIDALVTRAGSQAAALQDRPDLRLLARDEARGLVLWQLTGAVPRAYVVPSVISLPDARAAVEAMIRGSYAPRETVALIGTGGKEAGDGGPGDGAAGSRTSAASETVPGPVAVTVREEEGGRRRVIERLEAASGGFLVLPETWYPGWTARVDGEPAEVLPANGYQMAVRLPAGARRIELEFRPNGRLPALLASLAGLALLGGSLLAGARGWRSGPLG